MHRSEAEGRFGEAEPAWRASVCARATPFGVKFGGLDGVRIGSRSKIGKLQITIRTCALADEMVEFRVVAGVLSHRNQNKG